MKMKPLSSTSSTARALAKIEAPSVGADGVLPHNQWDQDLMLEVPNNPDIQAGFFITQTTNGASYGASHQVTLAEAGNPNYRFTFFLKRSDFPSGNPQSNLTLSYTVYNAMEDTTLTPPLGYTLIFDKQPPGGSSISYINFTAEQLQGIYPDSLTGGYLLADVSPWSGMAVGDVLTPWLANAPPNDDNSESGLLHNAAITVTEDNFGSPVQIRFSRTALLALGDTDQSFGYQLKDKLGNTSVISPTRQIPVHLQARAVRPKRNASTPRQPRVVRSGEGINLEGGTIEDLRPLDGRIKVARLSGDVEFTIPMPSAPIDGNHAQVFINGVAIGASEEVPATGTEFTLKITAADFATATRYPFETWSVDYSYFDPFSGDDNLSGSPVQLIVDRHAPGGRPPRPPAIAFTEAQLNGITEDDMDPSADALIVRLSSWFDDDVDDQVQLWLGTGPLEADGVYLADLPPVVTDPSLEMDVAFPRAALEAVGSNHVYFGYRITDWAGNVSDLSIVTAIDVFLSGVPANLLAPLVPDAAPYNPADGSGTPPGSGLLVWTEANPEATVRIPIYDNVAEGDRIYVLWNNRTLSPVTVLQQDIDDEPTNSYLLEIKVPFQDVSAGAPGANIPIGYRVFPVTNTPQVDSPAQYINVNLATPGGPDPDPDPETPEHGNMRLPRALSDFPGSVDNLIPPEAYASPAHVYIRRAGEDNKPIWLIDDILQVIWGDDATNNPVPIRITANEEPADLNVVIPAAMIAANGTGTIPLYFTLTRTLSPGNDVTVRSRTQPVIVQAPGDAPGGTNPLAVATFPESIAPIAGNPNRVIQRAVGMRGTTLRVPLLDAGGTPLANVVAGDFITVDFYGVDDPLDGAGHDNDPNKPVIPNSRITVTDHVILQAEIDQGYYSLSLPYAKTYFICRNLSVTKYSIRNAAGITKNAPDTLILFALNQAGGTCSLP